MVVPVSEDLLVPLLFIGLKKVVVVVVVPFLISVVNHLRHLPWHPFSDRTYKYPTGMAW